VSALGITFLFFVAMMGQWLWSSYFSLWGLSPQLLLVLTVSAAARWGPTYAMCLGFCWGIFLDTMSVRLFGANALALTLVGYGTGSVRRQIDVTGLAPLCLVVLIMSWAYFVSLGLLGLLFLRDPLWVGWPQFLLDPIYNVVLAAVLSGPWRLREH
jgi:rod shape-determining protein MreD